MKRFLAASGLMLAGILYLGVWGMLNQKGSMALVGNHGLLGSASVQAAPGHEADGAPESEKARPVQGERSGQKAEAERPQGRPSQADEAKTQQGAERQKQAQAQTEAQQKEAQAQAEQNAQADRKAEEQATAEQVAEQKAAIPQGEQATQQQVAAPKAPPTTPQQQIPARRPAVVRGGGSATSAGDTATSPNNTAVYPLPRVTAPVMPYPGVGVIPTAAQQPSLPWPIVVPTLATIALATALGLRRYRA